MDYSEVIDYLYSRLPMFTRDGASAFKKDLTNTLLLCQALGNPHRHLKAIHIAGTNGKGSSSHMLASILQTAGYQTGLYTSPHLLDFRERIKVNGQTVPQQFVIDFIQKNKALIEQIKPSFFEVTVVMAFQYFYDMQVDVAIIETGLGGRLDSTNIISPILSLITNIGYDHMNMLGNTMAEIAREKAGIIKQNTPVVISERQHDIDQLFVTYATEKKAPIYFANDEWSVNDVTNDPKFQYLQIKSLQDKRSNLSLKLDLRGSYQQKNIIGVLSCISQLNKLSFYIHQQHIIEGLANTQQFTGLMGRWQTLASAPFIICDTGHNEDGWKEVIKNIRKTVYKKLHMVIGVMGDKDLDHMLNILPKEATYYFCHPNFKRALPADQLHTLASGFGLFGKPYSSLKDALTAAQHNAEKEDLIFIGGSTFVVAEALPLFNLRSQ